MTSDEKPNNFVAEIDLKLGDKLIADLKEQGFEITKPIHTVFAAKKKGISCFLYQSGKLVVQGSEMAPFMEFYLEPEILKSFNYTYSTEGLDLTPRIGVDEAGKGDFFGPLCIAGVFAEGDGIKKLKEIGVKDSKNIADKKIIEIGRKIQTSCIHHIVRINPFKYNELYLQFKNLNNLLAWGHATIIEQLIEKSGCHNVIIDQFASEGVVKRALTKKKISLEITQRHRGEEDLVVAAASILARQAFLEGLEKLSKEFNIALPKGASQLVIDAGKEFIRKQGQTALSKVGKLHFKTLDLILNEPE
jgi:ribonuclease HIII